MRPKEYIEFFCFVTTQLVLPNNWVAISIFIRRRRWGIFSFIWKLKMQNHIHINPVNPVQKMSDIRNRSLFILSCEIILPNKPKKGLTQMANPLMFMVPEVGIEPTWIQDPLDFESSASTSFTTPAK